MTFDHVIVGAGSAGCVLANRLSANPHTRVLLLEAGPSDDSPLVRVPAGIIALMRSKRRNWRYWTAPQAALDGRRVYIPRGKTIGGSSSVNAMIYTRGHPRDYDHWAELGNPGWSWDEVLPVFRRSENNTRGADHFHGVGGPLDVTDLSYVHPVSEAYLRAGLAAGIPAQRDFNGAEQEGIGLYQVTQVGGERCNMARGYLTPVLDRPNLVVRTGCMAARVLLDGRRAVGVEYRERGERKSLEAGNVILAGGAINSPQLLLLSGIGGRAQLDAHGIGQRHDLPGVGQNLQDHPDAMIVVRSPRHDTMSLGAGSLPRTLRGAWQYARRRKGFLTTNVAEAGGFIKSRAGEDIPDLQLHQSAALIDNHGLNWRFSMGWGFSAHTAVLRPKARGSVGLASADPLAPPRIDPNLLGDPDDVQRLLRGVKIMRDVVRRPELAPWHGEEIFPGNEARSDTELRAFLRARTETIYHPVGTCKMGDDDMAVVDASLRVHGLDGLYVVDASVMPTLIGGNTNAPTVMIAEKAADGILGRT
ncbi:MAG TPA: GMC family oxidoreductase N-terminal domain-containing protein [Rhodanobacteraceae bacterium]|nr:GMC family oxidoreductase N-terminal domain-containing protein [Rhodanobacteraceae bacterium]